MKPLKVYWNGKYLRDIYPFATRYEVFKYRVRKFLRRVVQVSVIAAMLSGVMVGVYQAGKTNTIYAVNTDSFPAKVDNLKNDLVNRLADCERAGYEEEDAPIVLDTNKKFSIGVMQFQLDTIIHYSKVLRNENLTKKEATLLALDEQRAKDLAKHIIFQSKNGVEKDWVMCNRKLGLQKEVDIIKKLEK